MTPDDKAWWVGEREDSGSFSGPFATREEAIAEIADVGFVGYEGPLSWAKTKTGLTKLISARRTIEEIREDVCGELSSEHPEYEDWLTDHPEADEDELEEALNAALWAWMDKHGYGMPRVLVGVERIDVREAPRAQ